MLSNQIRITSSIVAAILEKNPFRSKKEIIMKKLNIQQKIEPRSQAAIWGNKYENICLYIFENMTGLKLTKGTFITHNQYQWLGGITDSECKERGFLVEFKSPFTSIETYKIPYMHWIQIQIDLELRNYEYGYLLTCKFKDFDTLEELKKHKVNSSFQLDKMSGKWNDIGKFWILERYNLVKINRDKRWFNSIIPLLYNFYTELCNIDKMNIENEKILTNIMENNDEIINIDLIKNYTCKKPLCDWIDVNNLQKDKTKSITASFLLHKKNEFCDHIIKYIKVLFNTDEIAQLPFYDNKADDYLELKTMEEIGNNTPIIINAHFVDRENGVFINIPLLIKTSYIKKLFNNIKLNDDDIIAETYHPVEITYSTLPLNTTNYSMRNENNIPFYKSKLAYTTRILAEYKLVEKYKCFLIGRGCNNKNINCEQITNVFLATGMYETSLDNDEFINKSLYGIRWIKDVMKNGTKWDVGEIKHGIKITPSKKYYDYWENGKEIAIRRGDLSILWSCRENTRKKLIDRGIKRWFDITPKEIELFPKNIQLITNDMICINKSFTNKTNRIITRSSAQPIHIGDGINQYDNIIKQNEVIEYYVDFEVINDLNDTFLTFPEINKSGNIIFMIGVVKSINRRFIEFKQFTINNLDFSLQNEIKIIKEWFNYINCYKKYKIFCWGNAEKVFLKTSIERAFENDLIELEEITNIEWIDFTKVMIDAPIVIGGCFSFKLKEVALAMYNNGLISRKWDDIYVGIDLMVCCWEHQYNKLELIKKYNKYDCEITYEIINMIRTLVTNNMLF